MNDLRSRNRALAAVPDEDAAPTSTPPRVRPETDGQVGRQMSRRQSIAERARHGDAEPGQDPGQPGGPNEHKFKSSRPRPEQAETGADTVAAQADADGLDDDDSKGPSSRPNRRREVAEDGTDEEDRFPWHFQFDDDEPEELQASSPLLSRAFRATIG